MATNFDQILEQMEQTSAKFCLQIEQTSAEFCLQIERMKESWLLFDQILEQTSAECRLQIERMKESRLRSNDSDQGGHDAVEQEFAGAMASAISVNNDNNDDKEHQVEALCNKNDKEHVDVPELLLQMNQFFASYNQQIKQIIKEDTHLSMEFGIMDIVEMVERNVFPAGLPRCGIG